MYKRQVLAYFTGIYCASLALLGDAVDSIGIALTPSPGYPLSLIHIDFQSVKDALIALRGGQ